MSRQVPAAQCKAEVPVTNTEKNVRRPYGLLRRFFIQVLPNMRMPGWIIGEFVGTFILVFFGCGSVAAAVLTGAQVGVFQVAIIWGLGIATAIYLTASLSGAHLNPAVTLSLSVWGSFPFKRVLPYIVSQLIGAFFASVVLYAVYADAFRVFELKNGIVRGEAGSEASAMVFGEFYPNPRGEPLSATLAITSTARAFFTELIGTALLVMIIFSTMDKENHSRPGILGPLTIGLTVTMLISLLGPLTMAGLNPARDLGPRLFSALAGWKEIPFSANGTGWWTVYILAPLLGGPVGGALYKWLLHPHYCKSRVIQG